MSGIKVISSGYYVPSHIVSNYDFEKKIETTHDWIISRTGIESRHFVDEETTSDLGYKAALNALNKADIKKEEIGLIIVATMTPDNLTPSTACLIQEKLGLNDVEVMAFDVSAACSGFVYASIITNALLEKLDKKYALIIGAETLSSVIDYEDRGTCILFGDGAGALVVKKSNTMFESYQNAEGNQEVLYTSRSEQKMRMNGKDVFKFAVKVIPECIEKVLEKSNLTLDDIDFVVCHQANYRIISHVYKKLKADESKFYMNLNEYGNTSGASIPLALGEMDEKGLLKQGMKIICVGFGGGLTYGASLFEW